MPRIPRGAVDGQILHLLNRGNGRATVFHTASDYCDFVALLAEARRQFDVSVFAFCLMPNHFHVVARGEALGEMQGFMQWWMTSQVRRYHRRHGGTGHIWQGRYKSFPVQGDEHALTVLRYVLRNPVRAGLVASASDWPWTSLQFSDRTDPWPVALPVDLHGWLNGTEAEGDLKSLRESLMRRRPFGDSSWQQEVADECELQSTLRPRGRPRTKKGTGYFSHLAVESTLEK